MRRVERFKSKERGSRKRLWQCVRSKSAERRRADRPVFKAMASFGVGTSLQRVPTACWSTAKTMQAGAAFAR